tara:strand:- start:251 stop:355 length:105 start_codon:yes stop_codon:yes gene_type:complete
MVKRQSPMTKRAASKKKKANIRAGSKKLANRKRK